MIKIEAIVRPERINQVTSALEEIGCAGFNYQNVTGQGQQRGVEVFTGRGGSMVRAALPKTLLVTLVPDAMKDAVIEAIIEAARSPDGGRIGDGIITISAVADVVRIRTGERGDSAFQAPPP
jgi:nitrogen regulatory protein P-II 1